MSTNDPWDTAERDEQAEALAALESRQRDEQAERMALLAGDLDEPETPKRRLWLRLSLVAVLVLAVLAALLPTIAGPVIKPRLESALTEASGSPIRVGKVRLSWFGTQRVSDLVAVDESLSEVVRLSAEVDRSLAQLLADRSDLGTLRITGTATLTERPDGSYAPLPPADPAAESPGPVSIPAGLRAAVELVNVDLRVVQLGGKSIVVEDATGTASLDASGSGSAAVVLGATAGDGAATGPVEIDLVAEGFLAVDGTVRAASASLRGEVAAPA
ncbi:MAG: hypothetical protein AAGF47_01905, partial [Planctomycetota bacterium]